MAVSITINTGDETVVIYTQDGNSYSVGPDAAHVLELDEGGFVTISDSPDEHPGEEFIVKMIKFWQEIFHQIRYEVQDPTATPV